MNPTNPCRGHAAESERAEGIEAAVRELRLFIMGESLQTRKEASKHLETLVKQIACGQAPGISGLLAEAHDASLDKDHMGCRAILKQCMRILEDAEVGRLPDGATIIDSGFRFDGQLQQHIPRLVIEFEPVPVGHPSDAKGWKDRDAVASMVAAALSAHADTQPDSRHELQARGTHPAPCARHCEATAFQIEIRNLRSQAKHSMLCAEAFKAEAGNLRRVLASLVDEIDSLIGESTGVYGLHQNGDPAPWHELLAGGRFQRLDLGEARAAVDRLAPASPAEILDDARRLIARAQHAGVVLTIETVSVPPLAMGRYVMRAATRPARHATEQKA